MTGADILMVLSCSCLLSETEHAHSCQAIFIIRLHSFESHIQMTI